MEVNPNEHIEVWEKFNFALEDDAEYVTVRKNYDRVFSKNASNYDYESILPLETAAELQRRWEDLSSYGSHPSFRSMIFTAEYPDAQTHKYSFFDNVTSDLSIPGGNIITCVDTFFIISRVAVSIFERHGQTMSKDSRHLETAWAEWYSLKLSKAGQWNFDLERARRNSQQVLDRYKLRNTNKK